MTPVLDQSTSDDYKRARTANRNTYHNLNILMTRKSIEACAQAFIVVLAILFVYSAYRVGEMIGFWG